MVKNKKNKKRAQHWTASSFTRTESEINDNLIPKPLLQNKTLIGMFSFGFILLCGGATLILIGLFTPSLTAFKTTIGPTITVVGGIFCFGSIYFYAKARKIRERNAKRELALANLHEECASVERRGSRASHLSDGEPQDEYVDIPTDIIQNTTQFTESDIEYQDSNGQAIGYEDTEYCMQEEDEEAARHHHHHQHHGSRSSLDSDIRRNHRNEEITVGDYDGCVNVNKKLYDDLVHLQPEDEQQQRMSRSGSRSGSRRVSRSSSYNEHLCSDDNLIQASLMEYAHNHPQQVPNVLHARFSFNILPRLNYYRPAKGNK